MAFQKSITDPRTGFTAEYWRVALITIAPADGSARIMLGGYANSGIREAGGVYVPSRAYDLGPAQFAALAQSPSLPVSDADRAEIEAHIASAPPAVAAFLQRALTHTMFDAIGVASYGYMGAARRPCQIDPDTGEGIAQDNGDRYPAEQIVMVGDVPTVPSEFADAVNV